MYFKGEKQNFHTPIFIETKKETTDLTHLSQFPAKLSFWNVKTNDQADGKILRYKKWWGRLNQGSRLVKL